MAKIRPLGDVLLDMEILLDEMAISHDMQLGEILALIRNQLLVHNPSCLEEYEDGSTPLYLYGHQDLFLKK